MGAGMDNRCRKGFEPVGGELDRTSSIFESAAGAISSASDMHLEFRSESADILQIHAHITFGNVQMPLAKDMLHSCVRRLFTCGTVRLFVGPRRNRRDHARSNVTPRVGRSKW